MREDQRNDSPPEREKYESEHKPTEQETRDFLNYWSEDDENNK